MAATPEEANVSGSSKLVLSHTRSFCPLHLAPFKRQWPTGFAKSSLALLDIWLQDPETKRQIDNKSTAVFYDNIHRLLDDKPLCCRVSKQQLMRVYVDSGISNSLKCCGCHCWRPGFQMEVDDTILANVSGKRWLQVCFYCLLHRVRLQSKRE